MKTFNSVALALVVSISLWFAVEYTSAGPTPAKKAYPVKIGYVDFQRILDESVVGKKAQEKLKKKFGPTKEMLEKKKQELKSLRDQIDKQKDVLSPLALNEKKNLFSVKYQSYTQQKQMLQDQYNSEFIKLVKPMLDEVKKIINQIGKEKHYTMIFKNDASARTDESTLAELLFFPTAIAYFDKGSDITSLVLKRYDAKHN